jgi:hypothetical protein
VITIFPPIHRRDFGGEFADEGAGEKGRRGRGNLLLGDGKPQL